MGFRFQRRKKITSWLGLNFSKSGIAPSIKTKVGSFNPKGFSLLTGIPGLTYRSGWKSRPEIGLILLMIGALALIGVNLIRIAWYLIAIPVQFIIHLIKSSNQ